MTTIKDKLKKALGFGDDYEYEDFDFDSEGGYTQTEFEPVASQQRTISTHKNENITSLKTKASMIIAVHEPLSYEESPKIVDDLKTNKAVVINFEQLDSDLAHKIFEFVSGAIYAIEGRIQKVNQDIFILAPPSIEIDGLKEELQNSGVFPW